MTDDCGASLTVEDDLLGEVIGNLAQEEIDEEELLGGRVSRAASEKETDVVVENEARQLEADNFEKEELDYEEDDEEKEERTSKFVSERAQTANLASTTTAGKKENNSNAAPKATNGRHRNNDRRRGKSPFRNNGRQGGEKKRNTNLPKLLNMSLSPPPMVTGSSKILVNPNFRPQAPPQQMPMVRLNLPGMPPISLAPQCPPLVNMVPTGPIIPRLPNGVPLVPLPPNHGVAGFGGLTSVPPPSLARSTMTGSGSEHWDEAVAAFLNAKPARRRRSRSSSDGSSSSSYSSRSRSRSRSSSRLRRRNEERDRSRRDRDRIRNRSPDRRRNDRKRDGRDRDGRRRNDRPQERGRDSRPRREEKDVSDECAKVVGIDTEYLRKMEEQKRKRDEMLKQKEMRRADRGDDVVVKSSHTHDPENVVKKKAFLCVCVANMKQLDSALTRIQTLAFKIGSVKKCWQFTEDQVNIIFSEHTSAKSFMLQYNNKVLSGLRMRVSLEKIYLLPSEVP